MLRPNPGDPPIKEVERLARRLAVERSEVQKRIGTLEAEMRDLHRESSRTAADLKEVSQRTVGITAKDFGDLQRSVTTVQAVAGVFTLVFVVLSGLAGWKVYQVQKFEAVRTEANGVMTEVLRQRVTEAINRYTVQRAPDDQKTSISQLVTLKGHLDALGADSPDFAGLARLVNALDAQVLDNDADKALGLLNKAELRSVRDPYVRARSLGLRTVILISKHPDTTSKEYTDDLKEAVGLDPSLAVAFNALGILETNKARQKVRNKQLSAAPDDIKQATRYYEIAQYLDPSIIGQYKKENNLLWTRLVLFNGLLIANKNDAVLAAMCGAKNVDAFFKECEEGVQRCRLLQESHPAWTSTAAEVLAVHAQYSKQRHDTSAANRLVKQAYNYYKKALDLGLVDRLDNAQAAVDSVKQDELLSSLNDTPYWSRLLGDTRDAYISAKHK